MVCRKTAERWCRKGRFPNATRVGRQYRVPASDVEAYLAARRVKPEVAA
ncbi:MAG: helix-turn-helix domain-containing protein [Planctomycetes bacterium]|nr:helix-turn-helix domain-containing protein [Planctomycetota bacterium]